MVAKMELSCCTIKRLTNEDQRKCSSRVLQARNGTLSIVIAPNLLTVQASFKCLLKRVGAGAPPDEERGEANSLDSLGEDGNTDRLERPPLLEDLGEVLSQCVSRCET